MRVLLVDKEEERNQLIKEALEKDGRYEVRTAECGFDAGLIAERFHPHVIFIDIMLEDINPQRICNVIRENSELQNTRMIAITSSLTEGEGQALLQQGFDDYLCKPFDIQQLIQCVDESLSIVH